MNTQNTREPISLTDVIYRSLVINPDDVAPLVKYLGMKDAPPLSGKQQLRARAQEIADYLREMGSNSFATLIRGGGVDYAEVVLDVARKLGAKGAQLDKSVEENEGLILQKLFADALGKMSEDERRQLFSWRLCTSQTLRPE